MGDSLIWFWLAEANPLWSSRGGLRRGPETKGPNAGLSLHGTSCSQPCFAKLMQKEPCCAEDHVAGVSWNDVWQC